MLGMLLVFGGTIAGATHATPVTTERLPTLDAQILTRLNATRAAQGLRPLVVSDELANAASHTLASSSRQASSSMPLPTEPPFAQRLKRFYSPSGFARWTAGENLLYNSADIDAATAIRAWLNSSPHRENMLNPNWREVGIASVHASAAGGVYRR